MADVVLQVCVDSEVHIYRIRVFGVNVNDGWITRTTRRVPISYDFFHGREQLGVMLEYVVLFANLGAAGLLWP